MPRYFFHSADGERERDEEGTELRDGGAAQLEAVKFAGEVLRHDPGKLWLKGHWRVEVTDDEGALLFTVITNSVDAPKRSEVRKPAVPASEG